MAVKIELPEDIEHHLEKQWGNLPRHALETLAIEGYRARVLSRSQVRRMHGFETGAEVDESTHQRAYVSKFGSKIENFWRGWIHFSAMQVATTGSHVIGILSSWRKAVHC